MLLLWAHVGTEREVQDALVTPVFRASFWALAIAAVTLEESQTDSAGFEVSIADANDLVVLEDYEIVPFCIVCVW